MQSQSKPKEDIFTAAENNDLEQLTHLISNGVDINAINKDGFTALHLSLQLPYFDIAKCLLANGADIHLADSYIRKWGQN